MDSRSGAPAAPPPAAPPPDIAHWRKGMRAELIARRAAVPPAERRDWNLGISLLLLHALPLAPGAIIGFCWPHKGEYDARPLLRLLRGRGIQCALPVVRRPSEPMIFRLWWPGVAMQAGALGIPSPVNTRTVDPDLLLVPLVGFGRAGDRLGYGGGYFDRTLAALARRPLCIGVGYELARVETTFPQPHDIPMDAIATEAGLRWREAGALQELTAQGLRMRLADLARERHERWRLEAPTLPG